MCCALFVRAVSGDAEACWVSDALLLWPALPPHPRLHSSFSFPRPPLQAGTILHDFCEHEHYHLLCREHAISANQRRSRLL